MTQRAREMEPDVDFEWVNAWQAAGGISALRAPPPSVEPVPPATPPVIEREEPEAALEPIKEALPIEPMRSADEPPPANVDPEQLTLVTGPAPEPAPTVALPAIPPAVVEPIAADQLMRDIAEIERARDALAASAPVAAPKRRLEAFTLVPSRTADEVPLVIGGVLALVMLTVFGAAAAMTKFGR